MKLASEFLYKPFFEIDNYIVKNHPKMLLTDTRYLKSIIENLFNNHLLLNEFENFIKTHFSEISFDKDIIIKMLKTSRFFQNYSKTTNSVTTILERLSNDYNLSVEQYEQLQHIMSNYNMFEHNVHILFYDVLEKYIEVSKYRTKN